MHFSNNTTPRSEELWLPQAREVSVPGSGLMVFHPDSHSGFIGSLCILVEIDPFLRKNASSGKIGGSTFPTAISKWPRLVPGPEHVSELPSRRNQEGAEVRLQSQSAGSGSVPTHSAFFSESPPPSRKQNIKDTDCMDLSYSSI